VYQFRWREIPGGHAASQTDENGVLTEPIPAGAKTGDLLLSDPSWAVVVSVASYGALPQSDGMAARLSNLQLLTLEPSDRLASADPGAVSIAIQRYKMLKALSSSTPIDQIISALRSDHDTL
jgi:hypothetical protein